jgi:hypothetical protein
MTPCRTLVSALDDYPNNIGSTDCSCCRYSIEASGYLEDKPMTFDDTAFEELPKHEASWQVLDKIT